MSEIIITDVQIIPVYPKDGLVSFASCIFNEQFYFGCLAIHTSPSSPEGYRLVYPAKLLPNGKRANIYHPLTQEAGQVVQSAVISKYKDLLYKLRVDEE